MNVDPSNDNLWYISLMFVLTVGNDKKGKLILIFVRIKEVWSKISLTKISKGKTYFKKICTRNIWKIRHPSRARKDKDSA